MDVLLFDPLYINASLERKFNILRTGDWPVMEQHIFLPLEPF